MYESSDSQFFRTTTEITGIQSGPDAFDESRFVVTFLTTIGVMEILCSFRLALGEKTGKEIPESSKLEFLGKFFANNFALSDAEDNTSSLLNRAGIADFVENTISNSPKVLSTKFLKGDGLFYFSSICFKHPFATITTSLSELYFRFRRFILLVQTEKVISMN